MTLDYKFIIYKLMCLNFLNTISMQVLAS